MQYQGGGNKYYQNNRGNYAKYGNGQEGQDFHHGKGGHQNYYGGGGNYKNNNYYNYDT